MASGRRSRCHDIHVKNRALPFCRRALGLLLVSGLAALPLKSLAQPAPSPTPAPEPTAPDPPAPDPTTSDPTAPPTAPPAAADVITPPRLLSEAIVDYPLGASGAAEVVLELVVGVSGAVVDAKLVEGVDPFASAALTQARTWRFEPAQSAGQARAARIRFIVDFTPPIQALPEPETPEPDPNAPAPPTPVKTPRPPPPPSAIEVTVHGGRKQPRAQSLTRAEVRQLPGAFGDPFRAIEALPGVTPLLSGVPFFYVRGAPPGNVGYFLDGIRLPLLYLAGLGPSIVHPALVAQVDLYPGAYPTRFGRFSGGIVAGEVEEPMDRWHGEWQIRLFDTGLMIEAPFAGGRGHVLLGGRYSYTAYLISLLGEDARLEYWDYQLRTNYRIGARDDVSVFAFGSFDYFGEDTSRPDDDLFSTEFHRIDLRHDHEFSKETALRSAFTWGFDRTRVSEQGGYALDRRLQLRSELESRLAPWVRLSAGADVVTDAYSIEPNVNDDFDEPPPPDLAPGAAPDSRGSTAPSGMMVSAMARPGEVVVIEDESNIDDDIELERLFPSRRDWVAGAYVDLPMELARFITLVPGLRFDAYTSKNTQAYSIEPRISAEFRVTDDLTLKNAIGLAAQPPSFVVPVAGFEIGGLPGGLQRSMQSSAGAEYRLPDAMKLTLTLFHNAFFNMTDILSLARLDNAEEELRLDTRARGQAYGMELMFHRDLTRRLGGFLSYTLSRSQRFTTSGRIAAAFDRTHVLNAVAAYDLGRRWRAGGRLVFYTGNPEFSLDNPDSERRLPPFHRLDVRIEKRWPIGTQGAFWAIVLEVLNSTLSKEVVARNCGEVYDNEGMVRGTSCNEEAIGPITIPSIAFEGRF